jgi:type VI secretion system protein ImpM
MRCGLFGKLPAKRDFVTLSVPRGFLRVWEPWLEQGLIESRRQIGLDGWLHVFTAAPIWRFWLGEDVCGKTVIGAMMPSVDACGRMFPLTLIGVAEAGDKIAAPVIDPLWAWFARAEAVLTRTLDQAECFEATREALLGLACLSHGKDLPERGSEDSLAAALEKLEKIFARLKEEPWSSPCASTSYFWTAGGAAYAPRVLRHNRMPAPIHFSGFLAERFALQPEPAAGMTL